MGIPKPNPHVIHFYDYDIGEEHSCVFTAGGSAIGRPEFVMTGLAGHGKNIFSTLELCIGILSDTRPLETLPLNSIIDLGPLQIMIGDVTASAGDLAPGAVEYALENGISDLRLYQIAISDMTGRFPWDVGCTPTFSIESQPIFFPHPSPMMAQ